MIRIALALLLATSPLHAQSLDLDRSLEINDLQNRLDTRAGTQQEQLNDLRKLQELQQQETEEKLQALKRQQELDEFDQAIPPPALYPIR